MWLTPSFGITSASVVSLTYFHVCASEGRRSLIRTNYQGPSLVPWDTPDGTGPHSEKQPWEIFTRWLLSMRRSITQQIFKRAAAKAHTTIDCVQANHGMHPALKNAREREVDFKDTTRNPYGFLILLNKTLWLNCPAWFPTRTWPLHLCGIIAFLSRSKKAKIAVFIREDVLDDLYKYGKYGGRIKRLKLSASKRRT